MTRSSGTWCVGDAAGHTQGVKTVGKFVLFVAALVGLYALPTISADSCPEFEDGWTCTERVESDASASGELAEVDRGAAGEGVGEADVDAELDNDVDDEKEVGRGDLYDISRGEIVIGEDEWPHDLLTSTKWSYDLIEPSVDENLFVITFASEAASTSAPRVMRSPPSRIQVLDADREDVVLDVEFPDEVRNVEWTDDDELVVVSDDGALTVFAQR